MIGMPRFTEQDANRAFEEWNCNCGPGALAAILGVTLDAVRPLLPGFDEKHYTNPTMMFAALVKSGRLWHILDDREERWPKYGLVRVQWEGPWTGEGVPMRARYRYTHWVGAAIQDGEVGVFDINCMNNGCGWVSLADWERLIVPHLTAGYKRATGKWHITHSIEVQP